MRFDIFHSIGRIDSINPRLTDVRVFRQFFDQAKFAESLGFGTVWVAESHFSSEVQKRNPEPVIPNYEGEVGLNADSPQLAAWLFGMTKRIGFGTAIMNIVGGNGGPIGAADRIRSLAFLNGLQDNPRVLEIGVASGRFPYINRPYGIIPRNGEEEVLWSAYKRLIFVEALEIFLRLSIGETVSSEQIRRYPINRALFGDEAAWKKVVAKFHRADDGDEFSYAKRWNFEPLKLVPELTPEMSSKLRFVLGSTCNIAREIGSSICDADIFNLSFTDPQTINQMHAELAKDYQAKGRTWGRGRMPRTVLVFVDKDPKRAREMASSAFDTYIEAMRGTAGTPPKDVLMARALIGDAKAVRDQLQPGAPHGFTAEDRLMLWFEFNQTDNDGIKSQMKYFADDVMPQFTN